MKKIHLIAAARPNFMKMMRSCIEADTTREQLDFTENGYALLTLHRPSNVDDPNTLSKLCNILIKIAKKMLLIFPVHPRTAKNLKRFGLLERLQHSPFIHLLKPLNYISFKPCFPMFVCHYRFRWHPGGNNLSRNPLFNPQSEY